MLGEAIGFVQVLVSSLDQGATPFCVSDSSRVSNEDSSSEVMCPDARVGLCDIV
ncbi:hypothetical protein F511_43341 [Dorcoceras hygrometricum]|uniref:Uncharacterized protein n=1 Tax=Dorcoceras hygrometricum TaxID=472368 RepID=A0A2Z7A611_9LAMI|nr:hypothetical protein F511_43341 [Dorcoceras hygrometricum]